VLVTLGSPTQDTIDRFLTAARSTAPTYTEIGAALGKDFPAGYRQDRWSVPLGTGTSAFDRAVAGLRRWEGHRAAGIAVHPLDTEPTEGATLALVIPVGPLTLTVANRIVRLVDEERRFAIVYGTLPAHGEQGEESFVINRGEDDGVTFDVAAFSRPVGRARLGGPLPRLLQLRATHRYLAGLQRFVAQATP
jgi:uncharacterized protein (UPF0548 family)